MLVRAKKVIRVSKVIEKAFSFKNEYEIEKVVRVNMVIYFS